MHVSVLQRQDRRIVEHDRDRSRTCNSRFRSLVPSARRIDAAESPALGTWARDMMTSARFVRLAWLAVLIGACATQAPPAHVGPSRVVHTFVSALNHADIDTLSGLFAPDATAFLPLDSAPLRLVGRDAIRVAFDSFFQELRQQSSGPEYMHLVAKNVQIQSLGNVAVVTFEAGSGPVTSRRTLVIEYRSGAWLITHFHGSNIRQTTAAAGA